MDDFICVSGDTWHLLQGVEFFLRVSHKIICNTGCGTVAHNPSRVPTACHLIAGRGRSLQCCLATETEVPLLLVGLLRNWEKCCSRLWCLQNSNMVGYNQSSLLSQAVSLFFKSSALGECKGLIDYPWTDLAAELQS